MKIIPALDIKNGKCVRLFQGNYDCETIYSADPVFMAKQWEDQGTKMLHIVDLDGAKDGKPINFEIINKIIRETSLSVQIGGGVRNIASIYRYIEIGSSNIILGTVTLEDRNVFKNMLEKFGEKIIVSLDTNNNILMKNGWKEKSEKKLIETISELESGGVKTVIYTDTIRDGTLTEPNYKMIQLIKKSAKMNLMVAGGISSIEQIKKLKSMNIDGVIIGKALYEGKIQLKEALKIC